MAGDQQTRETFIRISLGEDASPERLANLSYELAKLGLAFEVESLQDRDTAELSPLVSTPSELLLRTDVIPDRSIRRDEMVAFALSHGQSQARASRAWNHLAVVYLSEADVYMKVRHGVGVKRYLEYNVVPGGIDPDYFWSYVDGLDGLSLHSLHELMAAMYQEIAKQGGTEAAVRRSIGQFLGAKAGPATFQFLRDFTVGTYRETLDQKQHGQPGHFDI